MQRPPPTAQAARNRGSRQPLDARLHRRILRVVPEYLGLTHQTIEWGRTWLANWTNFDWYATPRSAGRGAAMVRAPGSDSRRLQGRRPMDSGGHSLAASTPTLQSTPSRSGSDLVRRRQSPEQHRRVLAGGGASSGPHEDILRPWQLPPLMRYMTRGAIRALGDAMHAIEEGIEDVGTRLGRVLVGGLILQGRSKESNIAE